MLGLTLGKVCNQSDIDQQKCSIYRRKTDTDLQQNTNVALFWYWLAAIWYNDGIDLQHYCIILISTSFNSIIVLYMERRDKSQLVMLGTVLRWSMALFTSRGKSHLWTQYINKSFIFHNTLAHIALWNVPELSGLKHSCELC